MSAEKQPSDTIQEIVRLVIEVGNPEFEPGLTRLQLGSNGQVQIERQLLKEQNRYDYKLDQKEAVAYIEHSRAPQLALKSAERKLGLPDEPLYKIEVYQGKLRVQSFQVWRSDLAELGELGAVIRALGQVVERASDGQALL